MNDPIITWYAKLDNDTEFNKTNEIYAGSYTKENSINVNMQIWNNRWGTEDVQPLSNFNINIYFDKEEDFILLDYCTVVLNKTEILTINKTDKIGVLTFDQIELSGALNDGTIENNPNNYILLDFIFKAPNNTRLKVNDLKTLFFEIIPL